MTGDSLGERGVCSAVPRTQVQLGNPLPPHPSGQREAVMVRESRPASKAGSEVLPPTLPTTPPFPLEILLRLCSFGSASKLAIASADNPVLELPTMREVLQPQDSPFKSSNNSGGGFGAHRLLQS